MRINKKSTTAVALAAVAALISGCHKNTNTNNNTNMNANTSGLASNVNANANPHRRANANHPITREEFERNKERHQREAKERGSRIGQGAEDLWLWTKARADLLATSGLTSTGINVDVDKGVITLRGAVPATAQKTRAEEVAKAVVGNKGVRNQLTISAAAANDKSANYNANQNAQASSGARRDTKVH